MKIIEIALSVEELAPYLDRLSDTDFIFVSDPGVVPPPGFPNPYSKVSENQFLTRLYAGANMTTLTWTNIQTEPSLGGDLVDADYVLTVGNPAGGQTVYAGSVRLTMQEEINGGWGITRWEDYGSPGSQSWTDLRANFFKTE